MCLRARQDNLNQLHEAALQEACHEAAQAKQAEDTAAAEANAKANGLMQVGCPCCCLAVSYCLDGIAARHPAIIQGRDLVAHISVQAHA